MSVRTALAVLALGGCGIVSTTRETATVDMHLFVTIDSSDADGTHVDVQLTGPFGDPDLGPHDGLSLTAGGVPTALVAKAGGGQLFAADTSVRGGDFTFSLHHEGDHDASYVARLPGPSGLVATPSGGTLSLAWTPQPREGMTTTLDVSGACITHQAIAVRTDTGRYDIPSGELQVVPTSCAITVTLAREVGVVEASLSGTLTQSETVQSTWIP